MNDKDKDAWRAELKRRGLENVKLKLMAAGVGRGANVRGFESPSEIPRGGVAGIIGVLVAVLKS